MGERPITRKQTCELVYQHVYASVQFQPRNSDTWLKYFTDSDWTNNLPRNITRQPFGPVKEKRKKEKKVPEIGVSSGNMQAISIDSDTL